MKGKILLVVLLILSVFLSACTCPNCPAKGQPGVSVQARAADHPAVTEQEKLMPCFECHKEATPEIYSEWFESGHGKGMVKCYECHGTYEDMKAVPYMSVCAVCHSGQFHKTVDGKVCWECHPVHSFTVHN